MSHRDSQMYCFAPHSHCSSPLFCCQSSLFCKPGLGCNYDSCVPIACSFLTSQIFHEAAGFHLQASHKSSRFLASVHVYRFSMRPVMYCTAYSENEAGHSLCCIHRVQGQHFIVLQTLRNVLCCIQGIQGWSCLVLHTLSMRLVTHCTAGTVHNASNVLYCLRGTQGWSCSVLQPQSTIR